VAWVGDLTPAELGALAGGLVLIAVLALQWWFLVNLLRQNGRLLERLEAIEAHLRIAPSRADPAAPGLPPGRPAPDFNLPGRDGRTRSLGSLLGVAGGKPLLLVFSDPDCGPCAAFVPDLAELDQDHASTVELAVVTRRDGERRDPALDEPRLRHVLVQEKREVMEAYRVPGTPTGVLIGAEGAVASELALGPDAIRRLLEGSGAAATPERRAGVIRE
jgi:thiol-disulfide isomerase/thioredoxin